MLRSSFSFFSCLVAGGLVVSTAGSASAQSYPNGYVTGASNVSVPPAPGAATSQPLQAIPETANGGQNGSPVYYEYCPPQGRHAGHGGHGHYVRTFSPPVKRPIYRTGVAYYKMWPNSWTGNEGAYPVTNHQYPTVYMPTDTTQLGYYYQHVPYWQPRQGMVPPPPVPSQWHTTIAQSQFHGHAPAGKIFGYAPTAVPVSPTPATAPYGNPGIAPTPVGIPPAPVDAGVQPSSGGLERSAGQPMLIPIN
ncbi:MAG TPA: hypothetical protein VNQ76_15460 [Planctomicrobium sp.]|nr:hypothetical protein [Planctomicrobium sp.]